jgi:Domain of unknown function (DUF4159)
VKRAAAFALVVAVLATVAVASAQDFFERRRPQFQVHGNQDYDGRLVFVRLRYNSGFSGFGGFGRRGGREPGWAHDYPTADIHMMKILKELTSLSPHTEGSNVLALDDAELFQYPIAYLSEPGGWSMSDEEVRGLRDYLLKGGFIIFDDFRGGDWNNLEEQMRRALPESHWVQLDESHPVFNSFFEIKSLTFLTSYGSMMPTYYGIFENNDPRRRLMAIANRDNDLGEYWEFSDTGMDPVDLSNEAYKFGVNYFIYGLTH